MDELAKQFSDVAAKYAPNVVDASLAAAQVSALSAMVGGVVAFGIAYALYRAGRFMWRRAGEVDSCDADLAYFAGGGIFGIALIPLCIGIWAFVDPWVWIALTRPEIYIAKRALGL